MPWNTLGTVFIFSDKDVIKMAKLYCRTYYAYKMDTMDMHPWHTELFNVLRFIVSFVYIQQDMVKTIACNR